VTTVLFARGNLRETLATTVQAMNNKLHQWNHDALLNAAEADVIEQLLDEAILECPTLLRDKAEMLPMTEVVQRGVSQFTGRPVERRVMQFTLIVPFTGWSAVFNLQADQFTMNPPQVAAVKDSELHLTLEGVTDAPQVWAGFNQTLDEIEKHLAWSRTQIDGHNQATRGSAPGLVAARRKTLLDARNMQAEIGFPIRRRPDADTYSVPIQRRKIRPVRPPAAAAAPFRPEPAMATGDYEAALTVLGHARNALERSPSTVARLGEEQIRDVLLINLNTVFEGDAAGEVFNGDGKTDILIRVSDRHIFIGECKVWTGTDSMTEALEQILEKYLVWRDTKAAILLFIRNVDVTAVIDQAVALIEAHPQYRRTVSSTSGERYDFIMHAADDEQREINLAFLPFALRTKATRSGR
jgi:hypothetical protein